MREGRSRDNLAEFQARLAGGVGAAVRRSRLGDWPKKDADALKNWDPGEDFAILGSLRGDPWKDAAIVPKVVDDLAARLLDDRPLLLATLLSPARVLARVQGRTPGGPVGAWFGMCWSAEAAWKAVSRDLPKPDYAVGDRDALIPLAARLRFLALSEPMRWRAEKERAWWYDEENQDFAGTELVRRVRGNDDWHLLVGECREARRIWLDCLAAYQSNSYLVQATPAEFEREVAAVVFRHDRGAPLGLPAEQLTDPAPLTVEDKVVIADVTVQHLLPRFDLRRVLSLAAYGTDGKPDRPRLAVGGVAVLLGLAAVGCAAFLHTQWAALFSALHYLVIGAGILVFGPSWAAPWLLRMPAAATVGVVALLGIMAGGWLGTPHVGLLAAVIFLAAAFGYLAVQLRNSGVEGRALTRSVAVVATGVVHALMISLLGLVYVAPAFIPKDKPLAHLWSTPGYGSTGMLLLLSTAWCLAVGVFSQILWNDSPVTAPLAHLSWRK